MLDTLLFLLGSVCYKINHFRHVQVPVMISFYQTYDVRHAIVPVRSICYQTYNAIDAIVPVRMCLLSNKSDQTRYCSC